jgi:signal transduction histidine kinase
VLTPTGTVLGEAPPSSAETLPFGTGDQPSGAPSNPNGSVDNRPPPGLLGGDQAQLHPVAGGQIASLSARSTIGDDPRPYLVQVYVSDAALHSGEVGWLLLLAGGSLALLLLAAFGSELLTRRIVRPLVQTADTAQQLTAGDVTARAPTGGPREVAEVGTSLNQLADRIDELVAEERETVANLSHRMRTPLTALRLEAESLQDPAERDRIGVQATALERTLTAVIHAARRPQREGRLPSADAGAVVRDRVAFWSALTDEQERAGTLVLPDGSVLVRASAEDLAAAVDALIENVVAHTPEGTPFAVSLAASAGGVALTVADDGPGLPEGAGVRGRSDRGSSGLGLDIARRCAQASGGWMDTGPSASGGTRITLHLGVP